MSGSTSSQFKVNIDNDAEGYFPYFEKNQVQEYTEFFKEVGVVVVNVLEKEQCNKTIDEIWQSIKKERPKIDKNDPTTWEDFPGMTNLGMFPGMETFSPMACENRQNPDVYNVFRNILGHDHLWVSIDRFGVLRPTKNIKFPGNEQPVDKLEWKTVDPWLHWDMNPWVYVERQKNNLKEKEDYENFNFISENNDNYNHFDKVQGLIALADTPIDNGGFISVLGFEKRIEKWAEDHKALADKYEFRHFVRVPKDDPMFQEARKIPVRAGCMVIWRGTQPHSNYPNNSSNFRYCQYIKMFHVPDIENVRVFKDIQKIMKQCFPKDFSITELGEKLYRQKPWDNKQNCIVS